MTNTKDSFINPEIILRDIGLQPGMQVADLGCGTGYFVFPAARVVGLRGRVYAVDVQKNALEKLKKEAQTHNIVGIVPIWSDIEVVGATKIPEQSLDMVFLVNTLFQLKEKSIAIAEAKKFLKPNGQLLIIDWQPGDTAIGPTVDKRISLANIRQITTQIGFKEEKSVNAGTHHFGLLFKL